MMLRSTHIGIVPTLTAAVLGLYISPAKACDGISLLNCELQSDQFFVCLDDDNISADLSKDGTEVVHYSTSIDRADLQPWDGFGRYRSTVLRFHHGDQSLEAFASFDTRGGDGFWRAGFNIFENRKLTSQTICSNRLATDWLEPVDVAKSAKGWCWDLEKVQWEKICN